MFANPPPLGYEPTPKLGGLIPKLVRETDFSNLKKGGFFAWKEPK